MIKENIKKIISLILAFFIISTSVPWFIFADETTDVQEDSTGSNDEYIAVFNEENAQTEDEFKLALRWVGTSNKTYSWNADKNEERVIKLALYYQNPVSKKRYAQNEITITVPGIGKLNRTSALKAVDIAADEYESTQKERDWSYKYDKQTDTYTFYNNKDIELGESFNGSFEMLWKFTSRASINNYNQIIQATLNNGEKIVTSDELNLKFTSKPDTFYINKTAKAITSADGLSKYVAEGKTVQDYAWVQYTFKFNVQELNARALKSRYFIDTLPEGCVIAEDRNVIYNEDGTVSYKIQETQVSENSAGVYSVIVGYPEKYMNQTMKNTVDLNGVYNDETEETFLATSTVEVELKKIQNQVVGIVPGKNMSPDYVDKADLEGNINFSTSLYATPTTNSEDEGYTVTVTDDLLEIYTPANTESGTEATYHTLQDNEYKFTNITVLGKNNFTNANGYTLSDGDYTLKLYALYAKDVNTRGLEEYTKIYEGKWGNSSVTKNITEDAVAIRAEISGLTESIKSFYISAKGIINVSENVANSVYENPSYIVNYEFTELKDKNGDSLIPNIEKQNYSQERLFERDSNIYGKGVLRAQDTITIRTYVPPAPTPGYYYATVEMEDFGVDKNVENFTTKISHGIQVNNKDGKELSKIEIHGVNSKEELENLVETIQFTQTGLSFKNALSDDVDMSEYLRQRATIMQEGSEVSVIFDFSDNPITSKSFALGYKLDGNLDYEEYYNSTDPSYPTRTYAYIEGEDLKPQSTASHNGKTMSTAASSKSILLALASHQQMIKSVRTKYSGDFVQEDAVSPINTEYTYRLKLRNGYNTLVNTEIIDILEHAELTEVNGEHPYETSEWYGTFKSMDTTYLESQGFTIKVYYANTLAPDENSWTLMENCENGIWTTIEGNESFVKAVKVAIEGEISQNSIIYADINMLSPNDISLADKKTYNTYSINCDAIDLYSGIQSTYMKNMPSNRVDVRLVEKEYDVIITKTDETSGKRLSGVKFGLYDADGNKLRSYITNILGKVTIRNLKEGTYILKEDEVPDGYEEIESYTLIIKDGKYTVKYLDYEDIQYNDITFIDFSHKNMNEETQPWSQNEDGTWQSNNSYIDSSNQNNSTEATMTSNEFTVVKEGTIIFDWSVSSESASCDYVYYTITNIETGETVGGANYKKIGGTSYGTVYDTLKYDTVSEKLKPGKYTISFTYRKDSSGYKGLDKAFVKNIKLNTKTGVEKTEEEKESTIENNVPTINLNIINKRAKGSIKVYKIDEYLSTGKKEQPLSGVQFDLIDPTLELEKQVIATGTTDSKGNILFENLDWGKTYILQEKQSPKGYELVVQNTYLSSSDKDKTVTIKDIRKKGTIQLTKQDEKDGTKIEGATYGLYANGTIYNENGEIVYKANDLIRQEKTDENGIVTFDNIIWGNYYLKETRTVYGYELSETKHTFTISASNVETIQTKTENEKRSKAILQIIKQDDEENFIEGVEFKLYKEDGTEIIVKNEETGNAIPYLTDELGRLKIENLEWGNYYIQEYRPAEGYEKINTKYTFTIDRASFENGNTVYRVTNEETKEETKVIINHKKTGSATLTKYACDASGEETENVLSGAVYELYKSSGEKVDLYKISTDGVLEDTYTTNEKGELQQTCVTDENGKITVEGLEWGGYYFQEKEAPQGYSISDKKISFVINNKTVDFTQELSAYDKLESGEIKINKTIKANSIYGAHGNSTFIFKIVGKDETGQEKVTLYKSVTFTENDVKNVDENGNITKSITISEMEPYKYEITEEKNFRYELDSIIPIKNAQIDENNGNIGIINLLEAEEKKGEITFKNEKANNSLLTDTSLITNTVQSDYYVIGISAKTKEETYEARTDLTKDDFEYTLLYSGGQEQPVEITGNVTIEGQDTYTQKAAGIYIVNLQVEYQGKTYDVETNVEFVRTIRILADEVEIGDYVNYDANSGLVEPVTYTTDSTLTGNSSSSVTYSSKNSVKWRVLSVNRDAGKIELIAARNLSKLSLEGITGYTNAENILNDIGAVYGHGKGATGGRSVNIGDIERYSSYEPYSGRTRTYTSGTFIKGEGITGGTEDPNDSRVVKASSSNPVTVTQTYYEYSKASDYFENKNAYNTLLSGRTYFWLASRCVKLVDSKYCNFNVRYAGDENRAYGGVRADYLYYSTDVSYSRNCEVVPVVSLEPNILTSGKDASGVWQLKFE